MCLEISSIQDATLKPNVIGSACCPCVRPTIRVLLYFIDRDNHVIEIAKKLKNKFKSRFAFHNKRFSELDFVSPKKFDAVVFDLGLSSIQLDDLSRGFSFKSKNELDMSMGLTERSAKRILNTYNDQDLKDIIKTFGDEKEASKIAKNIVKARGINHIQTTSEFVEIIKKSKKKDYKKKINESTKTFQAIRIFVNQEISELIEGIIKATKILKPGGKLVVISFHSIEDKIVKYFFSNFSSSRSNPSRYFPENKSNHISLFDKYKNEIFRPSHKEIVNNPPSRSAKLRYATRSKNKFIYPEELVDKFKKYLDLEKLYAQN